MDYTFDPNQVCECGKVHKTGVGECIIQSGAVERIPELVKQSGSKKVFIVADANTYPLAGDKITALLDAAGIACSKHIFTAKKVVPDEHSVGSLFLNYDAKCDFIIGIGSGVINDISKILAYLTKNPYMIVATAAYMDGYAAASSSMDVDGVKKTVASKSPDFIIGDLDILCGAPVFMARGGFGDMLAKYVSICEWRLSNLINGEYYCEKVAAYTRNCLKKCVDNAAGLLNRDPESMTALFSGLINAGKAMDYAGVSRPGGGGEHYFSHLWDMRGIAFGTPTSSHGAQVTLGTIYSIKGYRALIEMVPNKEKALAYVKAFDFEAWGKELKEFVGKGADAMIALEAKERKYDVEKHAARLDVIIDKWDEIVKIINEELPTLEEFDDILDTVGAPKTLEEIGLDSSLLPMTLKATKDIRDKYILSKLLWDLGLLDEICEKIF